MNNLPDWLGPALSAAIVPLVLTWMMRRMKKEARVEDGVVWLEYGRVWKGFIWLELVVIAGLGVTWFFVQAKDRPHVTMIIALFTGLAVPLILEFFLVRIGFDDARLYCFSGWRKSRVIPWDAVESYHFSPSRQGWVLRTRGHGAIRVHLYLSGLQNLLDELERRAIPKAAS